MSTEERRALGIIAALILLASLARWLERPRRVLDDAPAVDLAALEAASRAEPAAAGPRAPLDPNTATAAQLDALPGVGAALAARIVARGPYRSLEDLRRVPGIGAAMLEKIAPHVTLKRGPGGSGGGITATRTGAAQSSGRVDLNAADAAALDRIDGIGPALAARLVARRDSLGRFRGWDEVDAVAGVGPALLAKLRENAVIR